MARLALILLALFLPPLAYSAEGQPPCAAGFASLAPGAGRLAPIQHLTLPDGRAIAWRHHRAENPKGTVMLLNGLLINLKDWDSYAQRLQRDGYEVLQLSFSGQPDSLAGLARGSSPAFLQRPITPAMLVEEMEAVIQAAAPTRPLHLQGYSFGSMPAMHFAAKNPSQVESVILVTPMTKPLDHYMPHAKASNFAFQQMEAAASLFDPFGLFGGARQVENARDQAYRQAVKASLERYKPGEHFDASVDPEVFQKGIVELTMGAKGFDLESFPSANLPRINLILVGQEFYAPMKEDQISFFASLPASAQGNLLAFDRFGHNDILSAAEEFTHGATRALLQGDLPAGGRFVVNGESGTLTATAP